MNYKNHKILKTQLWLHPVSNTLHTEYMYYYMCWKRLWAQYPGLSEEYVNWESRDSVKNSR